MIEGQGQGAMGYGREAEDQSSGFRLEATGDDNRTLDWSLGRFLTWPYLNGPQGWTLSDATLTAVWRVMAVEGRAQKTFYDGGVVNETEFIRFMQAPGIFPVFLIDQAKKVVTMVAWLSNIEDRSAKGHFCVLGPYHRGMADRIVKYWADLKHPDGGPLFLTLVGVTPETYTAAIKMLRQAGFTTLPGVLPNLCNLRYEGRRVGAVISYYCPGSEAGG